MSLIAVPQFGLAGGVSLDVVSAAVHNGFTLNAVGHYVGTIFKSLAAVNVRRLLYNVQSRNDTGNTTVATIETVGATGRPSGTTAPGGTPTAIAAGTGNLSTTFATDFTLAANTYYFAGLKAIVVASGGVFASSTWRFSFYEQSGISFPYNFQGLNTSAGNVGGTSVIGLEDSTGAKIFIPAALPGSSAGVLTETWNNSSDPNRRGVRFRTQFPWRLTGIRIFHQSAGDVTVILYGPDGVTVLDSRFFDSNMRASLGPRWSMYHLTPTIIAVNTFYRLVFLPGSTNSGLACTASVGAAGDLDCWPGGQDMHWTTAPSVPANEASWTNTLTKRLVGFELVGDQLDNGVGGGGGGTGYPASRILTGM